MAKITIFYLNFYYGFIDKKSNEIFMILICFFFLLLCSIHVPRTCSFNLHSDQTHFIFCTFSRYYFHKSFNSKKYSKNTHFYWYFSKNIPWNQTFSLQQMIYRYKTVRGNFRTERAQRICQILRTESSW